MVDCGLSPEFFKIHFGPEDFGDASKFEEQFGNEPLICVSILRSIILNSGCWIGFSFGWFSSVRHRNSFKAMTFLGGFHWQIEGLVWDPQVFVFKGGSVPPPTQKGTKTRLFLFFLHLQNGKVCLICDIPRNPKLMMSFSFHYLALLQVFRIYIDTAKSWYKVQVCFERGRFHQYTSFCTKKDFKLQPYGLKIFFLLFLHFEKSQLPSIFQIFASKSRLFFLWSNKQWTTQWWPGISLAYSDQKTKILTPIQNRSRHPLQKLQQQTSVCLIVRHSLCVFVKPSVLASPVFLEGFTMQKSSTRMTFIQKQVAMFVKRHVQTINNSHSSFFLVN